jgi:hypothetical protein
MRNYRRQTVRKTRWFSHRRKKSCSWHVETKNIHWLVVMRRSSKQASGRKVNIQYSSMATTVTELQNDSFWSSIYVVHVSRHKHNNDKTHKLSTRLIHTSNLITGLDRPWEFKDVEAPRFQNGRPMKVVRLSALSTGHLYPQQIFLILISVKEWVNLRALVRPKRLDQWNILMTPTGIELATFRFVAQCLNQLRHRVPFEISTYKM